MPGQLVFTHLVLSPRFVLFCVSVAASTPNSTAGAAMNSLTSLGTLQGLAGATVGLNNINALAGTINSEYLLLWWTAFPQILPRKWSASNDLQGDGTGRTNTRGGGAHAVLGGCCLRSLRLQNRPTLTAPVSSNTQNV